MPTCIISFDCEGKWGLMDNLTIYHDANFTSENFSKAYKDILNSLEKRNLSATFAFVGAFTMEENYFREKWLSVLLRSDQHKEWLNNFLKKYETSQDSSWFCPELIPLVHSSMNGSHEICSHGFTHLPWDSKDFDALLIEVEGILDWYKIHSITSKTFIFPRNIIKNKELLSKLNVIAYRNKVIKKSFLPKVERLSQLLSELNMNIQSSVQSTDVDTPIPIPGEIFLNWRNGIRKIIPFKITVNRFEAALDHAIRNNGVINLWTHPHNFISGDRQLELFNSCLDILERKVKFGDIQVLTQQQYVQKNHNEFL